MTQIFVIVNASIQVILEVWLVVLVVSGRVMELLEPQNLYAEGMEFVKTLILVNVIVGGKEYIVIKKPWLKDVLSILNVIQH
jgi:hypothetical protein